jgi:GT2 family glycosyltransferase
MTATLSIVIVNYKSPQLIIDCLRSIYQYNTHYAFEIIIVDNHSQDGSKAMILNHFNDIKWMEMGYNAGFARANNAGIRQSTSDTFLLLNPDILFDDDSLEKCFQAFSISSHVASTVQLLNPDRTLQISGGYFIRGALNNLLPLPVLGKIFKWLGNLLGVRKTSLKQASNITEVDWINGAFMMVKKQAIEKAGMFDEDFFLYAEEIEWCSRLKKAGKLAVYGDLHAMHLQGQTANLAFDSSGKGYYNLYDKKGRQIMVSNFLRIRKQFGIFWLLFHWLFYVLEIPFFILLTLVQNILFLKNKYSFLQLAGYISNLIYLTGKIPPMITNKPHFYKVI